MQGLFANYGFGRLSRQQPAHRSLLWFQHGEAFIPLNKRNTKDPKKLSAGNPICDAGLAMHKDGKTSDGHAGLRQKFCCPFRQSKSGRCPCDHKNWNNGKKNRGCTKYKTIPADYRLSIDRDCSRFKRTYALRTECERYNSRFKASGQERGSVMPKAPPI